MSEPDENSRLLPAIPHRSYVYADELVIHFSQLFDNLTTMTKHALLITESNSRAGDDE